MTALPWLRSGSWWLGFLVVVNLYLIPWSGSSPRGTDALGAALAVWIMVRAHRRGVRALPLAALGVANALPLFWFALSILDGDRATTILAARWLLAIPYALATIELTRSTRDLERFAWGLIAGCGVNVGVVALQSLQLDAVLKPLGISRADQDELTWVGKQFRLPGLHRHYGASSAVTSLIVPPALWLYLRGRHGLWLPVAALGGLAFTLHVTFTRSPLVVAAVVVAVALLTARNARRSIVLAALLAAIGLPAMAVIGPPGGTLRWLDEAAFEANALERFRSTWAGVTLALENPWGLGEAEARVRLGDATSLSATHNAFVQAAMVFGLPLALILLTSIVHLAWGVLRGAATDGYLLALLALQLAGLFLFEEHLNNPTFLVMVSWMVAASADRLAQVRVDRTEVATA